MQDTPFCVDYPVCTPRERLGLSPGAITHTAALRACEKGRAGEEGSKGAQGDTGVWGVWYTGERGSGEGTEEGGMAVANGHEEGRAGGEAGRRRGG